jgi:hypothetical protein
MMTRYLIALSGVLIFLCSSAFATNAQNPLLVERWKHRPLVIITPDQNDPLAQAIQQALEDPAIRADFTDRAMVLYVITHDIATRNGEAIERSQADAIAQALKQTQPYQPIAFLIGLDGGVKLVQQGSVNLQEMFTLIDGMPMRQWQVR